MLQTLTRFICAAFFAVILFAPAFAQEPLTDEALKMLPDQVGRFRASKPGDGEVRGAFAEYIVQFDIISYANREYLSPDGEGIATILIKTRSSGGAYSILTFRTNDAKIDCEIGAACTVEDQRIQFSKGSIYVGVLHADHRKQVRHETLLEFARSLSATLDAEAGSIPPLALHLPEWERVQGSADFAVNMDMLQSVAGRKPVFDVISFDGGTEAAVARYDNGQLVIFEFSTPQYSVENDARIQQRIAELREAGQPVPSAYRREGNYSVFVFDAPDEAAATSLIEQVKYEKDVRWLGDNPHAAEAVERAYRMTMTGIIVTTLKATGLAILICLGVGGIFGGAIFLYRRTRPSANKAYTDAGGMLRLDIEGANAPRDTSKNSG